MLHAAVDCRVSFRAGGLSSKNQAMPKATQDTLISESGSAAGEVLEKREERLDSNDSSPLTFVCQESLTNSWSRNVDKNPFRVSRR